jgi:cell division protein WhiA
MSFSDELRDELASIAPRRRCCQIAELSGLCHAAGVWHLRSHRELAIHLDLASAAAARRAFTLLRELGVRCELRTYRRPALDRAARYQLHIGLDRGAAEVFREAGAISARLAPLARPPKRVVGRSCCRGSYLRGALLGGGSLSGPRAPHLELRASSIEGAELLAEVARLDGVELRIAERGSHAIAYAKSGETIADLLALAGANEGALRLDEHAVIAATRSQANRLTNADEANVKRTVQAAQRQLELIRRIDLDALPGKMREIAALRLHHPALSLGELASRCRPPITKAAAHHRMEMVRRIAEASEPAG